MKSILKNYKLKDICFLVESTIKSTFEDVLVVPHHQLFVSYN